MVTFGTLFLFRDILIDVTKDFLFSSDSTASMDRAKRIIGLYGQLAYGRVNFVHVASTRNLMESQKSLER